MNRRKFLNLSALTAPLLLSKNAIAHSAQQKNKPIVISTWDSGMPVNAAAWKILEKNGSALDAVEAGAIHIENDINCCVGLGGYPDRDGIVTLDACIMDHNANCGAVAGIERIKHPISVARKVMEKTPHVILVGNGAQQFALENGFTLESAALSTDAKNAYAEWIKKNEYNYLIPIRTLISEINFYKPDALKLKLRVQFRNGISSNTGQVADNEFYINKCDLICHYKELTTTNLNPLL